MPLRTGRRDWMWGVAVGVVVLIIGGFALLALTRETVKTYAEVSGVKCQSKERLNFHQHSHLSTLIEGEVVPVPADIGRMDNCLFWLHTHGEDGLVHVEAPEEQDFTLGQFFAVWGQPLSATELLGRTAAEGQEVQATVNGEIVTGDPAAIPLEDEQTIVLQLGPPFGTPPESRFESDE